MIKPDRNDHAGMVAHARWFAKRVVRGTYRRPEAVLTPRPLPADPVEGERLEMRLATRGERINGRETPRERL